MTDHDINFWINFWLLGGVLLGAPVLTGILWGFWIRKMRRSIQISISAVTLTLIIAWIVFWNSGWTFTSLSMDYAIFGVAYLAYALIVWMTLSIPHFSRYILFGLGISTLGAGILAVINILGFAFILYEAEPVQQNYSGGFRYKVHFYGWAFTSEGGSNISIYQISQKYPFLERKIKNLSFEGVAAEKVSVQCNQEGERQVRVRVISDSNELENSLYEY